MRLEGKIAIITGGAKGIGKCIALTFAREGANVVAVDVDVDELYQTCKEIEEMGRESLALKADVRNVKQVQSAVEKVIEKFGRIDILVNNAGGSLATPLLLEDVSEEDYYLVIDTNLKGTFFFTKEVIRYMKQAGSGNIINLSSAAGSSQGSKMPGILTGPQYPSAKAGVSAFTRSMARELGPNNINVNAVAPGIALSGPRVEKMWNTSSETFKQDWLRAIALKRLATVQEIANVILFLASADASYISGATIDVNGGMYMK